MKKIISLILCYALLFVFGTSTFALQGPSQLTNQAESYITEDGKYYDADMDAYLSHFIKVENGVPVHISASMYAKEVNAAPQFQTSTFEPSNTFFYNSRVSPYYFTKFIQNGSPSRPAIDTSYTYVVSALGRKGTTVSAGISKSISTSFSVSLDSEAIGAIQKVISNLGISVTWEIGTEVSTSYSGTVENNYGRMCFQPSRYTISGDLERWVMRTPNLPPEYVKTLKYNVETYAPAYITVSGQTFADGVYFLVESDKEFYENDLNK